MFKTLAATVSSSTNKPLFACDWGVGIEPICPKISIWAPGINEDEPPSVMEYPTASPTSTCSRPWPLGTVMFGGIVLVAGKTVVKTPLERFWPKLVVAQCIIAAMSAIKAGNVYVMSFMFEPCFWRKCAKAALYGLDAQNHCTKISR